MFGKPCFKFNGKAFAIFFENEMVFKLSPDVHSQAMNCNVAKLFDSSGKERAMKEWVQGQFIHKTKWETFTNETMLFVLSKQK